MKLKFTLIIVMILAFNTVKSSEYYSSSITTRNGLSQNDVHKIFQDSKNFIWIATNDGLSRYDGYDFKIYNKGYNGLESSLIEAITEDKNHNIWICTADKGLFMYNRMLDVFVNIGDMSDTPQKNFPINIPRMYLDNPNNSIWVCNSETGLYQIKMNTNFTRAISIKKYQEFAEGINKTFTRAFVNDQSGRLWIGTSKGLYYFDSKIQKFIKKTEFNTPVISIINIDKNKIAVLLLEKIVILDTKNQTSLNSYLTSYNTQFIFANNELFTVKPDGLYKSLFNKNKNEFYNEIKIDNYNNWTSTSITIDKNGVIWVGFLAAGIRQYKINSSPFKHYGGTLPIGNNFISSLFQDKKGNIWVGTLGTGLFKYPSLSGSTMNNIVPVKLPGNQKIIYSITQSPKTENIYIGLEANVFGNLMEINSTTGSINYLNVTSFTVRTIVADSNFLWIGTYEKGLYRYNLSTKQAYHISNKQTLNTEVIRSLIKDKLGNIWIGTDKGLAVISAKGRFGDKLTTNRLKYIENGTSKYINEYILPILESKNGNLWIGTLGDGVRRISNIKPNFECEIKEYTTSNGISNNTIKSIVEDNNGFIWISTNKGINKINPQNSKIDLYDISDGLQDYEFNELSGVKCKDGAILFGGVNGFNLFYPGLMRIDTVPPTLVLTDFLLAGQSVNVNEKYNNKIILNSDISETKKIDLAYNQNNFSFVFAGIHYIAPRKNQYRYKLKGFDVEWIKGNSINRIAKYTNIPPGKYQFILEGSNNNGIWNKTPLIVQIIVHPPFWATWYAYILYVIALIVIFSQYKKRLTKRRKQENEVMMANLEKKRTKDLMDMKVKFFTNISHEFRTPLTLILSPLQSFLSDKKIPEEIKRNNAIQTIEHNANILLKLINHLLNISKHDQQKLEVQLKNKNFPNFINDVLVQFDFLAQSNDISLKFKSSSNDISIWFDPFLMEQIIYNLISNAFKYTPKGGKINLTLNETPDNIELEISDTGYGISKDAQKHIFERFFSVNSSDNINTANTGIGLALTKSLIEMHNGTITFNSEERVGSTFIITIPKNDKSPSILVDQPESEPEELFINSSPQIDEDIIDEFDNNITLLVVDDNLQIIKLLTELFSPLYNILSAMNGQEALEIIHESLPNIIISDVMMPVMDGLQLCKSIKTDERISHIPVILLSAKATIENQTEGYTSYADGYCPKPFDNKMLIAITKSTLYNKRTLAQQFRGNIDISPTKITTTPSDEKFIRRLIQIIEDRIDDSSLSVEDLYNEIGMNANNLNKKLKALTNTTAKIFIRNIRLKRSAQLLKLQRYRVSDVAFDVGFTDVKHFRECFKKEFGVSPTEYKNGGIVDPDSFENED